MEPTPRLQWQARKEHVPLDLSRLAASYIFLLVLVENHHQPPGEKKG